MLLHFIFVIKEEELDERKQEFEYVKQMANFFQIWIKEKFAKDFEIKCDEIIDSFDDHRIAMSFLISGIRSKNCVRVKNCKNIETSFPNFKEMMNSIGMKIYHEN